MSLKICPGSACGGKPFMASSRTVLCAVCSDAADAVIKRMTAQGKTAEAIGRVVGLTKSNVSQRQGKLRAAPISITLKKSPAWTQSPEQAWQPRLKTAVVLTTVPTVKAKPSTSMIIGAPKQKPGPRPRPLCRWPSGNPAREMHICCRVPETGDIRCDDAA